jgi:hypothetical protein
MNIIKLFLETFKADRRKLIRSGVWCYYPEGEDDLIKLLVGHAISGNERIGLFPKDESGECHYCISEFENHGPWRVDAPFKRACEFKFFLAAHSIPSAIARSRSAGNYHHYIFFEEPVNAEKASGILKALTEQVFGISIEIFPKINHSTGGAVFLPLFRGSPNGIKDGRTVFVDDNDIIMPDQYDFLSHINLASINDLEDLAKSYCCNIPHPKERTPTVFNIEGDEESLEPGLEKILANCSFIQFWIDNQDERLTERLWEAGISNLSHFKGGRALIHKASSLYKTSKYRYSFAATERKIHRLYSGSNPFTCKSIARYGYQCPRKGTCGTTAPAGLAFR